MRGWQANKKRTCALPVVLGLCPKRKYPPRFAGGYLLFYKNPLYFQSGYAILGIYLGNYKYYAIQNIIVYKTKGANLYETDGR